MDRSIISKGDDNRSQVSQRYNNSSGVSRTDQGYIEKTNSSELRECRNIKWVRHPLCEHPPKDRLPGISKPLHIVSIRRSLLVDRAHIRQESD